MAAGGTPGNVQVGPGRIYVAPIGTTDPTDSSTALPSAWRAVGYTEDGSEFQTETTSEAVEVAEELDPIRYENTRRLSGFVFSMAESTGKNLALALNQGANVTTSGVVSPVAVGSEVRVKIVWDSDETAGASNSRLLIRQAYQSGQTTIAHRKAPAKKLIAVNFRAEKPDAGGDAWKFFEDSTGLI